METVENTKTSAKRSAEDLKTSEAETPASKKHKMNEVGLIYTYINVFIYHIINLK